MTPRSQQIGRVAARALTVPTDQPESDGTFSWASTTLVLAEVCAGGVTGIGYSYTDAAAATIVAETLAGTVTGRDAFDIPALWLAMVRRVRNIGLAGLCATAISAVDVALWDLKARLLGMPLAALLGAVRDAVPVYGSGGFTNYSEAQLAAQLTGWVEAGCRWAKMKIGSDPPADAGRVAAARRAIGTAGLFVDANGAYARKEALSVARRFADLGVGWFEEPVSSDDLEGLRLLRDRAPPPIEISAGEYGYTPWYFRRMVDAGAVDVLQADATRCLGITGFLKAAAIAEAANLDISAHCAPALHLPLGCALPRLRHLEWFHDHARIEAMLFDDAPQIVNGDIHPDRSRPGLGLELKSAAARRYAV